jgi:hypothetical protein
VITKLQLQNIPRVKISILVVSWNQSIILRDFEREIKFYVKQRILFVKLDDDDDEDLAP